MKEPISTKAAVLAALALAAILLAMASYSLILEDQYSAAAPSPRSLEVRAAAPKAIANAPTDRFEEIWNPEDWNEASAFSARQDADVRPICGFVRDRRPPASHVPNARDRERLRGCDAENLLFGLGIKADPVRARTCAFVEAVSDPDMAYPFYGRNMLLHLYANGIGTRRDLDLAIRLACVGHGSYSDVADRIDHLTEMRKGGGGQFDYCDHVSSSFAIGQCSVHIEALAKHERDAELAALTSTWPQNERRAFAELQRAHEAFLEFRYYKETDLRGMLRTAFASGNRNRQREEFHAMIEKISAARAPSYTAAQFRAADARLNKNYQALIRDAERIEGLANGAEGVRMTQRVWLDYRDAFIALARIRFPTIDPQGISAWVTEKRAASLLETPVG